VQGHTLSTTGDTLTNSWSSDLLISKQALHPCCQQKSWVSFFLLFSAQATLFFDSVLLLSFLLSWWPEKLGYPFWVKPLCICISTWVAARLAFTSWMYLNKHDKLMYDVCCTWFQGMGKRGCPGQRIKWVTREAWTCFLFHYSQFGNFGSSSKILKKWSESGQKLGNFLWAVIISLQS